MNDSKHKMETRSKSRSRNLLGTLADTPGTTNAAASVVAAADDDSPRRITKKRKTRAAFECIICLNDYTSNISFSTEKCTHQICRDCIRKYFKSVTSSIRYTTYFEFVQCPANNCSQYFITGDVLSTFYNKIEQERWWRNTNIKAYIKNKINCPLSGCRGVFDVDDKDLKQCTFTECYECRRGFCIACQNPWHPGEVRIVNDEEEIKLTLKKAEQNHWCRCPKCTRLIEKVSGCSTIRCICGIFFCYRCGGISDNHYCRNRCQVLNQESLKAIRSSMFIPITKKNPRV